MDRLAALLLAVTLATPGAQALEPDSELAVQLHTERQHAAERAIAEASLAIESGGLDDKDLARAFRARGVARNRLLQYPEALMDLSRAVELDPFNALYYEERAIAHLKLREFKQADQDLEMALGLESTRPGALREKGRLAFYRKDYDQAAQDFARLAKRSVGEAFVYSVLWMHISEWRAGSRRSAPLAVAQAQLRAGQWPTPLVRMYRGLLDPAEAIAAATAPNPRTTLQQRCEAFFYAGQEYLIRKQPLRARAAFEAAVATGVTEFLEYDWAVRELELLAEG